MKASPVIFRLLAVLFAACTLLLLLKPMGGSAPNKFLDGRHLYVSGKIWLSGNSPYDHLLYQEVWAEEMQGENFRPTLYGDQGGDAAHLYPPSLALVTVPIAFSGSWNAARWLLAGINILVWLITLSLLWMLISRHTNAAVINKHKALSIALVVGAASMVSSVAATIYVEQTSLFAMAGILGALYFLELRRYWLVAICVLVASIKPHLSLLLMGFLLAQPVRRPIFFRAALVVGLFNGAMLLWGGDLNPLPELQRSIADYQHAGGPNDAGILPGLRSLTGWTTPTVAMLGTFLVAVVALVHRHLVVAEWVRSPFAPQYVALVFLITLLCMPLHSYDYTLLAGALIALPVLNRVQFVIFAGLFLAAARYINVSTMLDSVGLPVDRSMVLTLSTLGLACVLTTSCFPVQGTLAVRVWSKPQKRLV